MTVEETFLVIVFEERGLNSQISELHSELKRTKSCPVWILSAWKIIKCNSNLLRKLIEINLVTFPQILTYFTVNMWDNICTLENVHENNINNKGFGNSDLVATVLFFHLIFKRFFMFIVKNRGYVFDKNIFEISLNCYF